MAGVSGWLVEGRVAPAIRSDRSGVAVLGVVFWVDLRRWAIRSARELRLVAAFVDGLSGRGVSVPIGFVASGVRAGVLEGVGVDPIRDEYCRTRELSGDVVVGDRVELSLGDGLTLLEGLGAGVESVEGRLDRDWISRRRAVMRSTMDCRPLVLRSETLGDALPAIGLGDVPAPIRLPMPAVAFGLTPLRGDEKDRSLDRLLF